MPTIFESMMEPFAMRSADRFPDTIIEAFKSGNCWVASTPFNELGSKFVRADPSPKNCPPKIFAALVANTKPSKMLGTHEGLGSGE